MSKKAKATAPRPSTAVPAKVQEDDEFRPLAMSLDGNSLAVESIDERVEEEDEWWEPKSVIKMHYQITLEDGQTATIFRNMTTGAWYRVV